MFFITVVSLAVKRTCNFLVLVSFILKLIHSFIRNIFFFFQLSLFYIASMKFCHTYNQVYDDFIFCK